MRLRYLVQETFVVPGPGPVVSGLLMEGEIQNRDVLTVEGTTTEVRVSFVDFHSRQTTEGCQVSLHLTPEDATRVPVGTTLVTSSPS